MIALLLSMLLGLALTGPVLAAEDAGPIYINSAQELVELANNCAMNTWSQGKTVILQTDISLAEVDFQPIPTFAGIFDGNGHTISGLHIDDSVTPAGLFSYLQTGAVVKDLNVTGCVAPSGDGEAAGGIVGENYGTLLNCSFSGTVSGTKNTGAVAGINAVTGKIENCSSGGAVFGKSMTGGIAGYNMGVIDGCGNHAYVNITSVDPSLDLDNYNLDFLAGITSITSLDTSTAASDTGGIAGYSAGYILNCTNHSTIGYQHIGYNVGGIAGRSCGYILNCINTADIYGRKDIGGIAGQVEPYIAMNLTEDTLVKLQRQLDELNGMIDTALSDANAGIGTVTSRLSKIADYTDSAAAAANNITTTGSVSSTVTGGGETSADGSVTVTPPQVDVEGSGGTVGGSATVVTPGGVTVGGAVSGAEIQGGLTGGSVEAESGSSVTGNVSASTQITMNTSLYGLSAAINGMSGQMRLLSGEISGMSNTLTDDMKAINDQINAISASVFGVVLGTEDAGTLSDTSEVDIDTVTLGKTAASSNSGAVYGDISVGGIAGSIAIEYELDPEDDVSFSISGTRRRSYEMKAVVQSCVNTGKVVSKRSYAGGICGKMDLGYITCSENYADTESENGDYVGGIAGYAAGTIYGSYSKCSLRGGSYIGGIVGAGSTDTSGEASSTVAGCYSLVRIEKYEQYIGAVSGVNAGVYTENYFVSDDLAGINRLSYAGMAEPIAFSDLVAAVHTLPDGFKQFTLRFVAAGETVKTVPFAYGDSFDETVYPEFPDKEGYYGNWDTAELSSLHFDTTVTAEYVPYVSNLHSMDKRANGRPIFIVEGEFDSAGELAVTAQPNTPSDFEVLPDGFWDMVCKCFTSRKLSRQIVEQWSLNIPFDGADTHMVRYLAPDADPSDLDIYVKTGSGWEKAETDQIGSYLIFGTDTEHTQVAVISTMPIWWVWLIAAALGVLIVILLIRLIWKLCAKWAARKAAAKAAKVVEAENEGDPDEMEFLYTSAGKPTRRWLVPLLIILALLCGIVGTAAFFILPDLMTGAKVYDLLKEYADKKEFVMELSVDGEIGSRQISIEALIDKQQHNGDTLTCIESNGMKLYYSDGTVYLENGNAYQISDLYPDYSKLLDQTRKLYQMVDITLDADSGREQVYTITAKGEDAHSLLSLLVPSAFLELPDNQAVTVTLTVQDAAVTQIHFSATGTMEDGD